MRKEYVSATRLIKYKECPYACKNCPFISGPLQDKGVILHDVFANFYLKGTKEAENILNSSPFQKGLPMDLFDSCKKTWKLFLTKKHLHFQPQEIITVESADGEEMAHGHKVFAIPLPIPVTDIDGTQVQVYLRGAMDLVVNNFQQGGIDIIDWKTGFKEADKLQADIYALASYIKYGKQMPIRVKMIYTGKNFKTDVFSYTERDLVRIYEYVYLLCQAYVRERTWEQRFSFGCPNCELRRGCQRFLLTVSQMPNMAQIDKNNFAALSKWDEHLKNVEKSVTNLRDEISSLMIEHVQEKGHALNHKGIKVELKERNNGYDADVPLIQSILENCQLPLWTGLTFSKTKLEKDLDEMEEVGMIKQGVDKRTIMDSINATLQPKTSVFVGAEKKSKKNS